MDDFLVFRKTKELYETNLRNLLQRFQVQGLTLNIEKCKFITQEVEFLGHMITPHGIKPIQKKIDAIKALPQPTNITELRSFLGIAQQL